MLATFFFNVDPLQQYQTLSGVFPLPPLPLEVQERLWACPEKGVANRGSSSFHLLLCTEGKISATPLLLWHRDLPLLPPTTIPKTLSRPQHGNVD